MTVPSPTALPAQSPRVVLVGELLDEDSRPGRRRCRAAPPSTRDAAVGGLRRAVARCAVTAWTTIVYCWRSSSASAKTYGSSRSAQNSASVQ